MKRLALVTLIATSAFVAVEPARAAPGARPRIVVATGAGAPELGGQLAQDAALAGFEVEVVKKTWLGVDETKLVTLARERDAVAAVTVEDVAGGTHIGIADRVTGKGVTSFVGPTEGEDLDRAAIVTMRAVELLRGSFAELFVGGRPRGELAPPPEVRALLPAEPKPRTAWSLGPAAGLSPGGTTPGAFVDLRAAYRLSARTGLAALAVVPVVGHGYETGAAAMTLEPWMGGLAFRLGSFAPTGVWSALDLGVAALYVRGRGRAPAPARGEEASAWSASPFVAAEFGWSPLRALSVAGGVVVSAAIPWPSLRIDDREVAAFGLPLVLLSARVVLRGP